MYVFMCMISWMIRPLCEITDQLLAVGTQNCFSTLFYTPYTNIKTSVQNAPKCTIAKQKIKKNSGEGAQPSSPDAFPTGEGDTPFPDPTPLGALGASIIAPLALGVPVPFHLRLEHCRGDQCEFMHELYIAEIKRLGAIFSPLTVWVYLHSRLHGGFQNARYTCRHCRPI